MADGDRQRQQTLYERALKTSLQGLALLENSPSENVAEYQGTVLLEIAELLLELERGAEALPYSTRAVATLDQHPILWTRTPEQILYIHARALRLNNQIDAADQYLRRAYERLCCVHNSLNNPEYRRTWLEDVRPNRQLVADAQTYLGLTPPPA